MQPSFNWAWRRKALAGDADAARMLAKVSLAPLYQFCLYRVGKDRHRCEEVVQETLVRALRQLEQYDPARAGDNIFPWLTGLAHNEISRVLARDRHTVSLDALWQRMDRELLGYFERLEAEPLAEELLLRAETRELVNATMSQLPVNYREALQAKYVQGSSVKAIAAVVGTTEKAIESLLTRARQAFRTTFLTLCRNL